MKKKKKTAMKRTPFPTRETPVPEEITLAANPLLKNKLIVVSINLNISKVSRGEIKGRRRVRRGEEENGEGG